MIYIIYIYIYSHNYKINSYITYELDTDSAWNFLFLQVWITELPGTALDADTQHLDGHSDRCTGSFVGVKGIGWPPKISLLDSPNQKICCLYNLNDIIFIHLFVFMFGLLVQNRPWLKQQPEASCHLGSGCLQWNCRDRAMSWPFAGALWVLLFLVGFCCLFNVQTPAAFEADTAVACSTARVEKWRDKV